MRTLFLILALLIPTSLRAQAAAGNPPLQIFADTAGVAPWPDGHNVYVTWIFAKGNATSLPSSGILVAFNCTDRTVKRLAHVVYHLVPAMNDSIGPAVTGRIEPDSGGWVKPVVPHLFELICATGLRHTQEGIRQAVPPGDKDPVPGPHDPRWQHDTPKQVYPES